MKIFNVIFGAVICAVPVAVHATEECPYFSPALALCSVHAYNIGEAQNPTDTARATEMNDIIGLKTTVMVQQLKQQYDELNAVVKRFKTQLNKAVLTSKIEVLTGNTSSSTNSSSGNYNSNNGVAIVGAADCSNTSSSTDGMQCLQRNIPLIVSAANSSKTSEAKNQLIMDVQTAKSWRLCGTKEDPSNGDYACCDAIQNSSDVTQTIKNLNKQQIAACANQFRMALQNKAEYIQSQNRTRNPWGSYP